MTDEKRFDMSKKWRWLLPQLQQFIVWPFVRPALMFFAKFKVYGLENIKDLKGSVIFAPNHASELDPILVPAAFPWFFRLSPVFYVVSADKTYRKDTDFKWRKHLYGGFFFRSWGAYPIVAGMKDYAKSMPHHERILEEGGSVCLFPEGRWSESGKHKTARGGVAYLAEKTGAIIIPTSIGGTWHLKASDFFKRKLEISISFGKPIYASDIINTEESEPEKYQTAAVKVMTDVKNNLAKLNE